MAMKPAVLQVWPSVSMLREALESRFEFYGLWEQEDQATFFREKRHFIIVGTGGGAFRVTESLVSQLPNLELVAAYSVGIDYIGVEPLKSRGVPLTNTPNILTESVAEAAILLLLAAMQKVVFTDRFVRDGKWLKGPASGYFFLPHLTGKRVGIIGLGSIGAAIARKLEGFPCSIGYWGRSAKPQFPSYKFYSNLADLAHNSDVLIAACALTDGTRGIVNREVLDALGPNGYLVNVPRGAVCNESELVRALVENRIAGAGLDVFEKEPHVPEELLKLENVVMQPHLSACTVEVLTAMVDVVVNNFEAQFSGKALLTPVAI